MRQQFFYLFMLFISAGLSAQNVGVGTTSPPSRLTTVGDYSNPTIPGTTSTGVLRVGVSTSNNEGIDIGKSGAPNFSGWVQSGFDGNITDALSLQPLGGSVGIGVLVPNASAALDVTSTTQGFLPPRMTLAQRNAIASPAEGLMISCTDCSVKGLHQYINGAWQAMASSNTGNYGTVVNPVTGKIWLDRNLGATQVATSSTDAASYGDLYQWGRAADGHESRTSSTHSGQASTFLADEGSNGWDGDFIVGFGDWLSTSVDDLWSGTSAENNPCPSGFRLPTNAEWNQERRTWSTNNAAGAFASSLKLPVAGGRQNGSGSIVSVGSSGYYWSSTVNGNNARAVFFSSNSVNVVSTVRSTGNSVRCLKD